MAENEAPKLCTTNGKPVAEVRASQTNETGQHDGYIVLCPDERAKGFVRPVRETYRHVGIRPTYATRELTVEEHARYNQFGYVAYEHYPEGSALASNGALGRFWTKAELGSGCGSTTKMGSALAETYARDPKFYGATFCVSCNRHFPVEQFVWVPDGTVVGS